MKIGDRIKQRRLELGLSVDELAEKLNKNRATIYRYESNDIENFPTTVLEPLAKELKTTPAYLMGWEEDYEFCDTSEKAHLSFDNVEDFKKAYDKSKYRSDRLMTTIIDNAEKLDNDGKKSLLDYSYFLLDKATPNLNAAHARTDIDIPEGANTSEDDIMDDDNF